MNLDKLVNEVALFNFGKYPSSVRKITTGICNEVFAFEVEGVKYICRMNKDSSFLLGSKNNIVIFNKLGIIVPEILFDDYEGKKFGICYQIQTKIPGDDLGNVIENLDKQQLLDLAMEVSTIFDDFETLPSISDAFGYIPIFDENCYSTMYDFILSKRETIISRNNKSSIINENILCFLDSVIAKNKDYFLEVKSRLYFDDMCSKNIMIEDGKFSGLVDLDFVMNGDYFDAIGRIFASWYGNKNLEVYCNEIMRCQGFTNEQVLVVKSYALITLIEWLSERGIVFNSNTSAEIDEEDIKNREIMILKLANELGIN